ncbi:MAG: zinc ABC transporter substrate-binding protein [Acidimicrobiia bacterium]|nr:zinc ABC transporter substrate-binding protein [Acidimicrobiia bacterium]MYL09254.1 zinc ABC transporter substrate-binding protein [Acidimicrobiia bacterium]
MRLIINSRQVIFGAGCLLAVLALIAAGCGNDDDDDGTGVPTVIATTSIWADVAANVACDGLAEVSTIIPPGGDPHAFQPSLSDRGNMEDAALIVANGLLLEEGLEDTIDAVEEAGTPVFRVADHVSVIEFGSAMGHDDHDEEGGHDHDEDDHAEDDGHGHAHAHGSEDPHVWFDPIRVADALPALSQALASQAGLDAAALDECVSAYRSELIALDAEVEAILAPLHPEDRLLVTNHDALGYFADRYGFQVIGTVIPSGSTLAAASPVGLQELVELIEETGVAAIFSESTHSSDEAEALGQEAGVQVLSLDTGSLGPADSSSGTYIGFIRTNAQKIAEGLG